MEVHKCDICGKEIGAHEIMPTLRFKIERGWNGEGWSLELCSLCGGEVCKHFGKPTNLEEY